jgi:hypothetical protein
MHHGRVALLAQAALQAADLAGTEAQQACCLGLSAFPIQDAVQDFQPITFLLAHLHPVLVAVVDSHASSLPVAKRTFLSR